MRIFASILVMFFAINLNAQNNQTALTFPESTTDYISFFGLNEGQFEKLLEISERKSKQLEGIKDLKITDIAKYIEKRNAINKGFTTSLNLLLIESQKAAFASYVDMIRLQNQKIRSELTKAGKSEQEIKLAIVEN
mgnify:FL=1